MANVFKAEALSANAVETLMQLFLNGPTWDGFIVSKSGRGELRQMGLCDHQNGWAFLTAEGVRVATEWDLPTLRTWQDKRWYRKAATLD